ncbi:BING4CT-domain-containing protein [Sistotremastrum suecicum HHB10207 ss-3]|uniref:U three protein 7 n=1 Tax=Sistotremastrum suecicum HHB10207 ss-3 TaxID=1314776 RepID=A0A166A2V4_9AGAM|nr:BING4CT-domain-containing protein [Sistotremastrum suecicum HHB10207 ss-3]
MEALISKADAIRPVQKKRRTSEKRRDEHKSEKSSSDPTSHSVAHHTSIPRSLRPSDPPPKSTKKYGHVADKKLRAQLNNQSEHTARSKALIREVQDELLLEDAGRIVVESDLEKTWRVGQSEVVANVGVEAAKSRKEWSLEGGPYRSRYTRNGRHLAIAGKKGHVATFDWQTGTLHSELQLMETCRDITFLQDQSHFAVAQKKYVFIYDQNGVELHRLSSHIEPTRLEFLPYHWLLASTGNTGFLKYQDTSTGQLVVEHRTKLGACNVMCQNTHNAVIHLGHQNGTVTLWTPNLSIPAVTLLAHLGPLTSVAMDPSSGGRYMATSGVDGKVKVWDCRNWSGALREWTARGGSAEVDWSQRGFLAVATGGSVNVFSPPTIHTSHAQAPPLYLTHPIPSKPLTSVRFAPFQDVLTIGHTRGLSSILVPGSGEPNFDSMESDPFENKRMRREREVKGLLDKIQPDMITLDPEFIGKMAEPSKLTEGDQTPFSKLPRLERLKAQGKADETELGSEDAADEVDDEDEEADGAGSGKTKTQKVKDKMKMRGRGKTMKRFLRKKRKNVIDPASVAIRAKIEKQKADRIKEQKIKEQGNLPEKKSALDRFRRTK